MDVRDALLRDIDAIDAMPDPPAGDTLSDKLLDCDDAIRELASSQSVDACIETIQFLASQNKRGGSAKNWGSTEAVQAARDTLGEIRDRAKTALSDIGEPPGELDRRAVELAPLWTRLIDTVGRAYATRKAAQNALDFDDLESMACALLDGRHSQIPLSERRVQTFAG